MDQKKQMTIAELEKMLGYKIELIDKKNVQLKDIQPGDVFVFGGTEYIVLEHDENGTLVITKSLLRTSIFDSSHNHYVDSAADRHIKNFEKEIEKKCLEIGVDYNSMFVNRQLDLIAMDGRRNYGVISVKAGLLTLNQYTKCFEILDKHRIRDPWFLCTPASTESNDCSESVCYVNHKNYIEPVSIRSTHGLRPTFVMNGDLIVEVVKNIA